MKKCRTVRRIVREPGNHIFYVWIPVYYCEETESYHRGIPNFLLPYKHYTVFTIKESIDNNVDIDLFNKPCDLTRYLWAKNIEYPSLLVNIPDHAKKYFKISHFV